MDEKLEADLKRCLNLLSQVWTKQSDQLDKQTNFIYKADSLDSLQKMIKSQMVNEQYALHRWYNFKTSTYLQTIFCDFGAIQETNPYHHDIDIYILGNSFDIKLTVFPQKLSQNHFSINTRSGKNSLIRWYYANQSQESRKQILNRIYVVCDGKNQKENQILKSEFDIIRKKVKNFFMYANAHGINKIEITDLLKVKMVYSEIIRVSY
jgi:hypothetical protein